MATQQLYQWQTEALELFLKNKKLVANVTTGAGKTQFAIECIKRIREKYPNYNILITVPKIVLLETQWLRELRKNNYTMNQVGVYYGYAKEYSKITLTTQVSIKKIPLDIFDVIIIDECHHYITPSLMKIIQHPFKYKLGLSASIYNEQSKHWNLLKEFDYNIYKYNTKQAIDDGLINTFIFNNIGVRIEEPEIKQRYDNIQLEIKSLMARIGGFDVFIKLPADNINKIHLQKIFNERNELILNYPRKIDIAADIIEKHKNQKILVFNQYNKISTKIRWHLVEKKIKNEIIDSNVKREDRLNIIRDYELNKFNVLLTSKVFDEGYNLPSIEVVIIISGSSTQRQTIQRIGRVLRKKDKPSIVYQIYVKDTYEEESANERAQSFKEAALETKEEIW